MKVNDNLAVLFFMLVNSCLVFSIRKFTKEDIKSLREDVRRMFDHAYSGYIKYAYPYDELRPLTCDGVDTWGSYSLTLIDALDTLAVMGNFTEFRRVANIVTANANFDANINVSVFETNIRIVGGLLSAHLLSHKAGLDLEPGWPCNGPLLRLAEDVAKRLLPAFDTKTGMPYGTVNLRYGIPPGETSVTCTAGVGTYILEFGTLTRLTGDPVYEEVALNALHSLFDHRSKIGLFGNHIDVETGQWTAQDSGIGAGVDSYFEYLVKGSILFGRPELRHMFDKARSPIEKYLNKNNWYVWASMSKGQVTLPVFQSLEAYWPGVLSLIGDVESGLRSLKNYRSVWNQLGFTPEFYNIGHGEAGQGRESYPLRPELAESTMLLYRATGDPALLDIGLDILTSIEHSARTKCGYATIKDARDHSLENRMESFFLAETTKYLYLLFDPDNFIHNDGAYGTPYTLPSGKQCLIDTGVYIFNTEAHPIDPGALSCCYEMESDGSNDPNNNLFDNLKGDVFSTKTHLSQPPVANSNSIVEGGNVDNNNKQSSMNETSGEAKLVKKGGDELEEGQLKLTKGSPDLKQLNEDLDKILKTIKNKFDNHGEGGGGAPPDPNFISKEDEPWFSGDEREWENESYQSIEDSSSMTDKSHHQSNHIDQLRADPVVVVKRVGESTQAISLAQYIKQLVQTKTVDSDFDPQTLLEKIRLNRSFKPDSNFELLTCAAQTVFDRVAIASLFYNN